MITKHMVYFLPVARHKLRLIQVDVHLLHGSCRARWCFPTPAIINNITLSLQMLRLLLFEQCKDDLVEQGDIAVLELEFKWLLDQGLK